VAVTVKVLLPPVQTDAFAGCVVIVGAEFTVSVAALDVVLPQVVLAITRYWLPLMPTVTAFSVIELAVWPAILFHVPPPFVLNCHWNPVAVAAVAVKVTLAPAQTVWLVG